MECTRKHYIRDNKYGVTWCLRCGRLFTKLSGRPIKNEDREKFNLKIPTDANQ
jgi:hypothetical protein